MKFIFQLNLLFSLLRLPWVLVSFFLAFLWLKMVGSHTRFLGFALVIASEAVLVIRIETTKNFPIVDLFWGIALIVFSFYMLNKVGEEETQESSETLDIRLFFKLTGELSDYLIFILWSTIHLITSYCLITFVIFREREIALSFFFYLLASVSLNLILYQIKGGKRSKFWENLKTGWRKAFESFSPA